MKLRSTVFATFLFLLPALSASAAGLDLTGRFKPIGKCGDASTHDDSTDKEHSRDVIAVTEFSMQYQAGVFSAGASNGSTGVLAIDEGELKNSSSTDSGSGWGSGPTDDRSRRVSLGDSELTIQDRDKSYVCGFIFSSTNFVEKKSLKVRSIGQNRIHVDYRASYDGNGRDTLHTTEAMSCDFSRL